MPEYPDIENYLSALRRHFVGRTLTGVRIRSPFLLRTVSPRPDEAVGRSLTGVDRSGKQIVFEFANVPRSPAVFFVIHLMIAGRLRMKEASCAVPRKWGVAAFDFDDRSLLFTEASPKKRASLSVVLGASALAAFDRGSVEVVRASRDEFAAAVQGQNRTLKRVLTDPGILSGIGNAYSDEILHRAQLSPFRRTGQLAPEEIDTLHRACIDVLEEWRDRLAREVGGGFPDKVTAFHPEMAVHGRYGQPCPVCGHPVQRVKYAEREANYCATCQTDGRLLADRSLSRLLKDDWPRRIEDIM